MKETSQTPVSTSRMPSFCPAKTFEIATWHRLKRIWPLFPTMRSRSCSG